MVACMLKNNAERGNASEAIEKIETSRRDDIA
jgi:hypothetical protein